MGLTWKQATKYAQSSECGAFAICFIRTEERGFYEAWRTRLHDDGPGMIQTGIQTADAARKLCENYLPK